MMWNLQADVGCILHMKYNHVTCVMYTCGTPQSWSVSVVAFEFNLLSFTVNMTHYTFEFNISFIKINFLECVICQIRI